MAKNSNLTDFLTDVADAIREKEVSSEAINPQDFVAKIRSIAGLPDVDKVTHNELDAFLTDVANTLREARGTSEPINPQAFSARIASLETRVQSWIIINQTISSPTLMVSGDVNGIAIRLIRKNSHRYLCKKLAEGEMAICQLSDEDSTKYADGSTADLSGLEGDVFMRLPKFGYTIEEIETDVYRVGFSYGEVPEGWREWSGNELIGVYEAYASSSKLYSVSGVASSGNLIYGNFIQYATNRGKGYKIVSIQQHNMMALLYLALYGNTNCQDVVGYGTEPDKRTGQTDLLGMEDTSAAINGNSQSINFWGLENWWGNKFEAISNVEYLRGELTINGETKYSLPATSNWAWVTKMSFNNDLVFLPKAYGGSATTGYCDAWSVTSDTTPNVLRRSMPRNITYCGVFALMTLSTESKGAAANTGTRLSFIGNISEIKEVSEFKSL